MRDLYEKVSKQCTIIKIHNTIRTTESLVHCFMTLLIASHFEEQLNTTVCFRNCYEPTRRLIQNKGERTNYLFNGLSVFPTF